MRKTQKSDVRVSAVSDVRYYMMSYYCLSVRN